MQPDVKINAGRRGRVAWREKLTVDN